jgi:hemerythrin
MSAQDAKSLVHHWEACAEQAQEAVERKDFRAFKKIVREGNKTFKKLKEVLSQLSEKDEDLVESVEAALSKWLKTRPAMEEWKEELGTEIKEVESVSRRESRVTNRYAQTGKKKGKNVRLFTDR